MLRRIIAIGISLFIGALVGAAPSYALEIPPAPSLTRPIIDTSKTLSDSQITQLADQISASRNEKSYQIGILMIPSLDGRAIEDYSLEVARAWGIGQNDKNNGVLLLIAKDDRKLRIEVGSGLEGDLTDAESGRIIRNTITPEFREGKYFSGISKGIDSIQAQVEGRADASTATAASGSTLGLGELLLVVAMAISFMVSWLGSILGRSKSWWAGGVIGGGMGLIWVVLVGWGLWSVVALTLLTGGGLLLDFLVSRNYKQHRGWGDSPSWWAGSNWFGGGGGGGFGGGGFSGGGSSGGW